MRARTLRPVIGVLLSLVLTLSPIDLSAQQCGHWLEVLAQSFIPQRVDDKLLRELAVLSEDEYFDQVTEAEAKALAQLTQGRATLPDVEVRLRFALKRFYEVGYDLYGVQLDGDNLIISSSADINAFASGSWVAINYGTIKYFTSPIEYFIEIGAFPRQGYTVDQYNYMVTNFNWREEWNSIYFILAHEAAHNLMRHRDEKIWKAVGENYSEYREAVLNYRKDVAHGRKGGGVRRYLWSSLRSFLESFSASGEVRRMESEADLVAAVLLRRAGFDPANALTAGQRMALLFSAAPSGKWQRVMTEVLCSSHPDWRLRIAEINSNLSCMRFSGKLCQERITYPVEQSLAQLKTGLAELDQYHEETIDIAEGRGADPGRLSKVSLEVDPSDAELLVDGDQVRGGNLNLTVGPHTVLVSRPGFEEQEMTVVVFPDVQPKIKVKLRKRKTS